MNLTDIILVVTAILLPLLYLIKPILNYRKSSDIKSLKDFVKTNGVIIFTVLFFMLGFFLRLYKIGQYPRGFNQDEASLGYDAWAILNYGIDRNGIRLPVHLIAWGSGQNALYAYICMPFIKLFGLTAFSIRLPMALIGCVSLLVMNKLLKTISTPKMTVIGTFLFAIMPWHIMKSRWGLESNIFPDIILLAVLLIILGINGKRRFLYLGSVVLGISAYAYGTSYFFLPVFLLILFLYLLIKKQIQIKHALISVGITAIVSLPIILFVLINQFDWNAIATPLFTIPKLNITRQASILNISGDFFGSMLRNLGSGLKMLLLQNDSLPWNSIPFYGTHYVISLPFTLLGIFMMIRKKGFKSDFVFLAWLITSLLMLSIMSANINRINIIFIPLLYFTVLGVYSVIIGLKHSLIPIMSLFIIVSVLFAFTYFNSYQNTISTYFYDGLGEAIEYSETLESEKIVVDYSINAPYIYELFYNRINPGEYLETVVMINPGDAFEWIQSFGRYDFEYIQPDSLQKSTVYILGKTVARQLHNLYPDAAISYFGHFAVIIY